MSRYRNEPRSFSRSVRMSERVKIYIEEYECSEYSWKEGSFAEKFNCMVLHFMERENELNDRIEHLSKRVAELNSEIANKMELSQEVKELEQHIKRANNRIKSITGKLKD